uniref:Uncharacterized protein n=1 Tax=Angiostrongylus cantonensis TaxID=6313 RepID=A0A0K0DA61_ANGCA
MSSSEISKTKSHLGLRNLFFTKYEWSCDRTCNEKFLKLSSVDPIQGVIDLVERLEVITVATGAGVVLSVAATIVATAAAVVVIAAVAVGLAADVVIVVVLGVVVDVAVVVAFAFVAEISSPFFTWSGSLKNFDR